MKKKLVKKTLIYLFIISLLVHLPLVLTPHELVPDAKVYLKSAQGLEETRNEGFVFLLKLFLLLKLNVLLMRLSLATIASLSVFTVFYSARVFVDEKKALLTTLFYVFNPFFIYYTSFLITESVYLMLMPLFIVVPYSFLRKEKHRVEDFVAVGVIAILIVLRYTLMLGYLLSVMLLLKDVFVEKAKSKKAIYFRNILILGFVSLLFLSPYLIANYFTHGNPLYFMLNNLISNYSKPKFSLVKLFAFLVTPAFLPIFVIKNIRILLKDKTLFCMLLWIIITALFYNYSFTLFDTIRLNLSSLFAWSILASFAFNRIESFVVRINALLGIILSYLLFVIRFFVMNVSKINIF